MTEAAHQPPLARLTAGPRPTFERLAARSPTALSRARRLLKGLGIGAIALALGLLGILLATHRRPGLAGLPPDHVKLDITSIPAVIDPQGTRRPARHRAGQLRASSISDSLASAVPRGRRAARTGARCADSSAPAQRPQLRRHGAADPSLIGQTEDVWLVADAEVDQLAKGADRPRRAEADRRLNDRRSPASTQLKAEGRLAPRFNRLFFTTDRPAIPSSRASPARSWARST